MILWMGREEAIVSDVANQAIGPRSVGHAMVNPITQIMITWCLAVHILNHPYHLRYISRGSKQITIRLGEARETQDQSIAFNYKQQQFNSLLFLWKNQPCQLRVIIIRLIFWKAVNWNCWKLRSVFLYQIYMQLSYLINFAIWAECCHSLYSLWFVSNHPWWQIYNFIQSTIYLIR